MAEGGAVARHEKAGEQMTAHGHRVMPDRVHSPVDRPQPTRGEPMFNLASSDAESGELSATHDSALAVREARNGLIRRAIVVLTSYVMA
jgi:hypothetical protein